MLNVRYWYDVEIALSIRRELAELYCDRYSSEERNERINHIFCLLNQGVEETTVTMDSNE